MARRVPSTLVEVMSRALWSVTSRDTRAFFDDSGYRKVGQLL